MENPTATLSECAKCHKNEKEASLRTCSRCKSRAYCGNECQTSDWPAHKANCQRQNFVLEVELQGVSNPIIKRTLSCPAITTFEQLHATLQVAFGYRRSHAYDFKIKDPSEQPVREQSIADLLSVRGIGPKQNLLRIVQKDDFRKNYMDASLDGLRKHILTPQKYSSDVKLWQVFEKQEFKGCEVEYEYDFGAGWKHNIKVVDREESTDMVVCVGGEGHGVAEDVGGVNGWEELKKAYQAEAPTIQQKEKMEWFEKKAINGDWEGLAGSRADSWDKDLVDKLFEDCGA